VGTDQFANKHRTIPMPTLPPGPLFDLATVKNILNNWGKVTIKGRATVQYTYRQGIRGDDRDKRAKREIIAGIKKLTPALYSHVYPHETLPHCDVYGLPGYKDYDWYVKFHVEKGCLIVVSFHPPERDIEDPQGGIICPKHD
jgi:hypothetical protein